MGSAKGSLRKINSSLFIMMPLASRDWQTGRSELWYVRYDEDAPPTLKKTLNEANTREAKRADMPKWPHTTKLQ
jgi:hypothetical protein